MQLYANTGGVGLGSFELKLRHDTSVCEVVPSSGGFSSSFTGPIEHSFSAAYSTEATERLLGACSVGLEAPTLCSAAELVDLAGEI